ncbi:MAG: PDZ domain-containing protein [Bryobacteraceae bacterium]
MYRLGMIALAAASVAVWILSLGELADWGRFRLWWAVKPIALLDPDPDTVRVERPFARHDLIAGDVILAVDGKAARPRDWWNLLRYAEPGRTLQLTIQRGNQPSHQLALKFEESKLWGAVVLFLVMVKPLLAFGFGVLTFRRFYGRWEGVALIALASGFALAGIMMASGILGGVPDWLYRSFAYYARFIWALWLPMLLCFFFRFPRRLPLNRAGAWGLALAALVFGVNRGYAATSGVALSGLITSVDDLVGSLLFVGCLARLGKKK